VDNIKLHGICDVIYFNLYIRCCVDVCYVFYLLLCVGWLCWLFLCVCVCVHVGVCVCGGGVCAGVCVLCVCVCVCNVVFDYLVIFLQSKILIIVYCTLSI
jgi:hypothetical protein